MAEQPRVAVVTSVYGGSDVLTAAVPQDIDCEWVLVTDQTSGPPGWRVITEPRPHVCPRMASKVARARPDLYANADIYLYIDGNVQPTSPEFVSWAVAPVAAGAELAAIRSVQKPTLTSEIAAGLTSPKYAGQDLDTQGRRYLAAGHPDDWGIWWSGLMARSASCPKFGVAWLAEMAQWGTECQLSLGPVLRAAGVFPASLDAGGEAHPGQPAGNGMFFLKEH